jgi:hypothetical protein
VTITANPSVSCGTVSKVEFLDNGTVVAADTTSPYTYSWPITDEDNGPHSWVARVYDAIGQNTTSLPVSLTVNIESPGGWVERYGGTNADGGNAVAVDSSGNIVVAGYFYGTTDFRGSCGALTSAGGSNIFIAKYSPSGTCLWAKRFGSTSAVEAKSVAVDSAGNIIVVGYFVGTVDFGGQSLTSSYGSPDIFIAKFLPTGTRDWAKRFGDATSDAATSVAVDGYDNIVMTGYCYGFVSFGGATFNTGGAVNAFIVEFSPAGTHQWSTYLASQYSNSATGITVDNGNNVVVTGTFQTRLYFGGPTGSLLTGIGGDDLFLIKLLPSGNLAWMKSFGSSSGNEAPTGVAVDNADNSIVITGAYTGPVDFGNGPLPINTGYTPIFLAKFSQTGSHIWSRGFLTTGKSTGVTIDRIGDVVVTGYFQQTVDLGNGSVTAAGLQDIFVAKYAAANGNYVWDDRFGGTGFDRGNAVTVDGSTNNVVVTGYFQQTVDFGGINLTSAGNTDIFLLELTP